MIDERREAQAGLYVLGALPVEEVHEFETALHSDLELQLLTRELRHTADLLPASFPQHAPPPELKARILGAIDDRPAVLLVPPPTGLWFGWMPWALAACFAILCVALISVGHRLQQQTIVLRQKLEESNERVGAISQRSDQIQTQVEQRGSNFQERLRDLQQQVVKKSEELQRQKATQDNEVKNKVVEVQRRGLTLERRVADLSNDNQQLRDALGGLNIVERDFLSQLQVAVLYPTGDNPGRAIATAVYDVGSQKGVVVVDNLSLLPPTQDYQLWVIDPNFPTPVSAGLLGLDAQGHVRVQFTTTGVQIISPEKFAVSIERKGGAPAPTGRIVLASN